MGDFPQEIYEAACGATESSTSASATSVLLLAANSNRKYAMIRNDSTATLYLSMGGTAATSSPVRLTAQQAYELPARYTGAISGIWDVAVGAARVLEFG